MPDPIPDIGAGTTISLSVIVKSGNDNVTGDADLAWSVSSETLGALNRYAQTTVIFTAGVIGETGTISCEATYDGKTVVVESPITVEPPFLDSVSIVPSEKSLDLNQEWTFNATAYDSVGASVTDASFAWAVTGMDSADYALSATTGFSVTFSASVEGDANLTVTATKGTEEVSGTAGVDVGSTFTRSAEYYFYDMFNHPLGEWYDARVETSGEWIVNNEYPYLYIWEGPPAGNIWIYTFMRMDMVAENLPELNMNENPEFLPYFSDTLRGGTAVLDWYVDYVTLEECEGKLTGPQIAWYDGWYAEWAGTVLLDEDAAKAVLNITTTEFDDFGTWWDDNAAETIVAWEDWMMYEAGPERLAIFNMYEWDLQFLYFDMLAEKSDDDHVLLTFDTISWGIEALMTRWMHETWMPTEWYFEDMHFDATIGPERADVQIDAAVEYAVYAYEDTLDSKPCWCWEALMQDYVVSLTEYPDSLFELYEPFTYLNWAPGSTWYGTNMSYDYSPGAWNLTDDETLIIEWPAGDQMFFTHKPGYQSVGETLVNDTRQIWDEMVVRYAEPMPSDTDCAVIDLDNRQIIYTGPFDMWTWSKDQTAHEWLASEWDRIEILPYGIPFVEIVTATEDEGYDIEIVGLTDPVPVGEPVTFTVKAVTDVTRVVAEDYAGTVTFEIVPDDATAVLPADYTFVPATDMGLHEFTVTFNTVDSETHEATYTLTASDVADGDISGTASDILVVEYQAIGSFVVEFFVDPVIAAEPTGITVTAFDQWGGEFTDYEGTVTFASDDTGAVLPPDTPYTSAMDGVQTFNVTFSTDGNFYVNVSDVDVTDASGQTATDVLPIAEASYFELTPGRDPAKVDDPPDTMTVTVFDQYDREFLGYDGTVEFETNQTGDVTLPPDTPFVLGSSSIEVELSYLVVQYYMIYCNDSLDSGLTGSVSVRAESGTEVLDHFTVTGITDMWENNYSSVTVSAYNTWGTIFVEYDGEITFSTNALSGATLPGDYTFVPATDSGVKEFEDVVSFADPGTFNVTVADTSDLTKKGSQEDIVIEDLVATSLVITGPDTTMENDTFSIVVTVYHQGDEVFTEYDGTVEFETSDDSGFAVYPVPYEFVPADAGERSFPNELLLAEVGSQTVNVTDDSDASVTDTLDIEVTPFVTSELTYTVYDMFGEEWGPWWEDRPYGVWDTDRLLTSDAGNVTTLYAVTGVPKGGTSADQGMIYAPYRWNVAGVDLPSVDVHNPEFMPIPDGSAPVLGAEASAYIYAQYLHDEPEDPWWTNFWMPTWGDHPDWDFTIGDGLIDDQDGWIMGTYYEVTLNREAALEWLGMPVVDDPVTWWGTGSNADDYLADWKAWIDDEGNDRLDIFNGYDYTYIDMGTLMMLSGDASTVTLEIAHMTWGYEALMARWLVETGISPLEVYYEDFEMTVDYREDEADVAMDTVCQWSLHCSKSNQTDVGDTQCSWVWEPYALDYIISSTQHPDSDYDAYSSLDYYSQNCGDPMYGTHDAVYEATPTVLNLPSYATLVVELPDYDVVGYKAQAMDVDSLKHVWLDSDYSDYDEIKYTGDMVFGWSELNGLADYTWNSADKILTLNGPWTFDNPHPTEPGLLLHGAPWLEFDVVDATKLASSSACCPGEVVSPGLVASEEQVSASVTVSAAGEIVTMVGVMAAVLLLVATLVMGAGRRRDLD
ncbi:MAG: hypothetical protein WBD03_06400 [Thermoplasmata archaeon]